MKLLKVGAAVLNQTPLDWDGNARRIRQAMASAREQGVGVLCLPELCISGYGCEDAFHSPGVWAVASEVLLELVPESRGLVCSVGLPYYHHRGLYNCAALLVDGQIAGLVGKRHLAGDGLHYEPRWFKPWPENARGDTVLGGVELPIGDLLFEVGGVRIGFEICEDAWVAQRPGARLAARAADLILNPSASHFAFDKKDVRERFVIEGSRAFGVAYVYANLLGNEAGRAIYDGDAHVANAGKLLATGSRFSFDDLELTCAVVDLDEARMVQARTGSYVPAVRDDEQPVSVAFVYPQIHTGPPPAIVTETWETGGFRKEESFARAVALGLFDYLRKSRSRGFVVSLSGGADSAAVTCLVALMVELGCKELGAEAFVDKLGIPGLQPAEPRALVHELLTCVYQGTRNSSQVTADAARAVAEAVGARFFHLDVDPLVKSYTSLVEHAIDRPLTWEQDDITLQNIQARARGPSVWMLANLRGALLLATSNRSEAAVGYATMDGDTCGGLSPIAGIDKAFLRRWLRWMETEGPAGLAPIPALRAVNVQAPTAELRPAASMQTDEGDLMPYEILDAIEGAAIRDKHTPTEVLIEIHEQHPDLGIAQLAIWVERFFRLWCRNQWKRERYAPSFHVDDKNLDPKTWCRFPILSGGYERELAAMRAWAESQS